MVNFNTLFDNLAKNTIFPTFEGVPKNITSERNSTYVPGSGIDPDDSSTDAQTVRAVFVDLTKERLQLVNGFTEDYRDAYIIQSELIDSSNARFIPKLEDVIIDYDNKRWIIKKVDEDPANVLWILMVVRQ